MTQEDKDQEIWVDVSGYEGLYQVSNFGRVKRLPNTFKNKSGICSNKEHFVGYKGSNGYMFVVLHKNNRPTTVLIHRLVAMAFIPNPDNLPCINHKDETHDNNKVENLEWCTKKYNNNYGTLKQRKSIIMDAHPCRSKVVVCVNGDKTTEYPSARNVAKKLGVHPTNIINCCNGKQKTCRGMKFYYKDKGLAIDVTNLNIY